MEFSWQILIAVFLVNLLWIGVMFAIQELDESLPLHYCFIPGTNQRFLHMQDFHTMTWGDLIGIPLIANMFVHLAMNGFVGSGQWLAFFIIAIVDAVGFRKMCLGKNHKPDMGFPEIGKVSWTGFAHLPYHGVCVAMTVLSVWHIALGNLRGPVLYVGLAGGVLYLASFIADIRSGNFDPLKRV